jgi:AraC-like DNA-binding protein
MRQIFYGDEERQKNADLAKFISDEAIQFYMTMNREWEFDLGGIRTLRLVRLFSPTALARRSYFYLQVLSSMLSPSHHYTRRNSFDSYLLTMTFAGQGHLEYENKSYTLNPGQGFIIDCKKPHYYCAGSRQGWGYHIIHFNGFAMADYFSRIKAGGGIIFPCVEGSKLPKLFEELYNANDRISGRAELLTSWYLTDMLTSLILTLPEHDTGEEPERIAEIRGFIDENYRETLSLDALADRFAISKYHLCRVFKRRTGHSPHEYLTDVRIANAKALLHATDMKIADIAMEAGFTNNPHFFEIFRKYEGISPAEYRKRYERM